MGKELFKNIPSKVGDLVKDVRNGRIGLPDLQRHFVWKDNKVREIFDSVMSSSPKRITPTAHLYGVISMKLMKAASRRKFRC